MSNRKKLDRFVPAISTTDDPADRQRRDQAVEVYEEAGRLEIAEHLRAMPALEAIRLLKLWMVIRQRPGYVPPRLEPPMPDVAPGVSVRFDPAPTMLRERRERCADCRGHNVIHFRRKHESGKVDEWIEWCPSCRPDDSEIRTDWRACQAGDCRHRPKGGKRRSDWSE